MRDVFDGVSHHMSNSMIFDKNRAGDIIAAILNGGAIQPPSEGWTSNDLTILAGVAMSEARAVKIGGQHLEHVEAKAEDMANQVELLAGCFADLASMVENGEYPFSDKQLCEVVDNCMRMVRHGAAAPDPGRTNEV